jgi:hypothetical protein
VQAIPQLEQQPNPNVSQIASLLKDYADTSAVLGMFSIAKDNSTQPTVYLLFTHYQSKAYLSDDEWRTATGAFLESATGT